MKRMSFDGREQSVPASYAKPALACTADGCRWVASAGFDGRMFCLAHIGEAEPKQWPHITAKTNDLQWFADFIAEVQRAVNSQVANVRWLEFVDAFWQGTDYPELAPIERERKSPTEYLYRMLGEAQAMATSKARPKAFLPYGQSAEWKKSQRLALATRADE